jgi:hypothetical protein
MVSATGLGMSMLSAAAADGVGGRSLNSGTEEDIRWRFAADGGFEVKARLMGSPTWRFGSIAGVAMAERSLSSLLLALLKTLEWMLLTGVRLRLPEAAAAAGDGVMRGS